VDPDPGGPKTRGSGGSGFGSATLLCDPIFVGHFCPPGIRIQGPHPTESGSNPDTDPDPQHCFETRLFDINQGGPRVKSYLLMEFLLGMSFENLEPLLTLQTPVRDKNKLKKVFMMLLSILRKSESY
jgi:hypothetical protein